MRALFGPDELVDMELGGVVLVEEEEEGRSPDARGGGMVRRISMLRTVKCAMAELVRCQSLQLPGSNLRCLLESVVEVLGSG